MVSCSILVRRYFETWGISSTCHITIVNHWIHPAESWLWLEVKLLSTPLGETLQVLVWQGEIYLYSLFPRETREALFFRPIFDIHVRKEKTSMVKTKHYVACQTMFNRRKTCLFVLFQISIITCEALLDIQNSIVLLTLSSHYFENSG